MGGGYFEANECLRRRKTHGQREKEDKHVRQHGRQHGQAMGLTENNISGISVLICGQF